MSKKKQNNKEVAKSCLPLQAMDEKTLQDVIAKAIVQAEEEKERRAAEEQKKEQKYWEELSGYHKSTAKNSIVVRLQNFLFLLWLGIRLPWISKKKTSCEFQAISAAIKCILSIILSVLQLCLALFAIAFLWINVMPFNIIKLIWIFVVSIFIYILIGIFCIMKTEIENITDKNLLVELFASAMSLISVLIAVCALLF